MIAKDELYPDCQEDRIPEIVISIDQSIVLKKRAARGEFATFYEALRESKEDLHLAKVGDDWFSEEALSRLRDGIRQAENGNVIPGEIVMAELDASIEEEPEQD